MNGFIPTPAAFLLLTGVCFHLLCPLPAPAQFSGQSRINIPVADEIDGQPLLIIYKSPQARRSHQDTGRTSPRVVLAVWEDGTVVWSSEVIHGGEPYFKSTVEPDQLNEVLQQIGDVIANLPDDTRPNETRTVYVGPSSSHSAISVTTDDYAIFWLSWHEIWDSTGRHVSVNGNIRALAPGETVEEVRARDCSEEYLRFVEAWDNVKEAALALVPEDSTNMKPAKIAFRNNRVVVEDEAEGVE